MKEWVALLGLGTGLFVTALVGTLAVQGRLNHAGTRGLPVVSWLFPAAESEGPSTDPGLSTSSAPPDPGPEQPLLPGPTPGRPESAEQQSPPADIEAGGARGLFAFPQLDGGMTDDEIDRALRAAHESQEEARRERARLETMAADLVARQRDLEDRESAIAAQMMRVDQERDRLERRIAAFEDKVLIVERDEWRGMYEYARTLASFDPARAAAIVLEEWQSDDGRKRITKVLSVMDPADADTILARIEPGQVREVLLERLKVVREPRSGRRSGASRER